MENGFPKNPEPHADGVGSRSSALRKPLKSRVLIPDSITSPEQAYGGDNVTHLETLVTNKGVLRHIAKPLAHLN